jgi:hypothetical protein
LLATNVPQCGLISTNPASVKALITFCAVVGLRRGCRLHHRLPGPSVALRGGPMRRWRIRDTDVVFTTKELLIVVGAVILGNLVPAAE